MTEEITKTKSFEDRMMEKMRDAIGDLITEEELKAIVDKGMEKAFFEKKIKPKSNAWEPDKYEKSLAEKIAEKLLKEHAKTYMEQWIVVHEEDLKKIMDDVIKKGLASSFIKTLDGMFHTGLYNLQNDVINSIEALNNNNNR